MANCRWMAADYRHQRHWGDRLKGLGCSAARVCWAPQSLIQCSVIVQDILRVRGALDDIVAAKGAKVPSRDNRRGRRRTREYTPPSCPEAEEATRAKWQPLDPM